MFATTTNPVDEQRSLLHVRTHSPSAGPGRELRLGPCGDQRTKCPDGHPVPGFRAGYWAADRKTGTVATFVLFETEEGIRAAEQGLEQMRPMMESLGVRFASVENLEVLVIEDAG